jgi:hypothetical protein
VGGADGSSSATGSGCAGTATGTAWSSERSTSATADAVRFTSYSIMPTFAPLLATATRTASSSAEMRKTVAGVALDVDLRELATAEALCGALAEGQQRGAHGGHPVLVHGRREGCGHGKAVEGHDGGGLDLRRLRQQRVDRPVEPVGTAAALQGGAVQVGHRGLLRVAGRVPAQDCHRPDPVRP